MGEIKPYFTWQQRTFLNELLRNTYITSNFYLTGGTALSACYLNHRYSEDIDLFSRIKLEEPTVADIISTISVKLKLKIEYVRIGDRLGYTIVFPNNKKLKVDIVSCPYEQIERPTESFKGLPIDSKADIAVNKLMTISQRTASKDFVDLYFLLKKFTTWDLMHGVVHKFKMEIEPFYLSSLFNKAEDLNSLPQMKKKLTLDELKTFFQKEAKKLALTMVRE